MLLERRLAVSQEEREGFRQKKIDHKLRPGKLWRSESFGGFQGALSVFSSLALTPVRNHAQ